MLAGVLLHFILLAVASVQTATALVLAITVVVLIGRLFTPALAAIEALIAGVFFCVAFNLTGQLPTSLAWSRLTYIEPRFDAATLIGLGIPLFLVTMASQNLPGAAVLKTAGYTLHCGHVHWAGHPS